MGMKVNRINTMSVEGRIWSLLVPAVISQFVNILYSVVDRIFIGKIPFIGVDALSGIGTCFPILILINAFAQLLAIGSTTAISIYLGRESYEEAEKFMGTAFSLSCLISLVLFVFLQIFKRSILMCFGASENTVGYALSYLDIYLWGLAFQLLTAVFSNFLFCQGYAKKAMFVCTFSALLNAVLDYIFIMIFGFGISGAAYATVISQVSGMLLAFYFVNRKEGEGQKLYLKKENITIDRNKAKQIVLYGIASFTMNFTEACLHATYNYSLQKYGADVYIAAMAIIQSLMQIMYIFSNGIAQAVQPTISYYHGAGDEVKIKRACFISTFLNMTVAILGSILLIFARRSAARIFTGDDKVLDIVVSYLPIYLAGWGIFGIQESVQCIFVGLGKAGYSMFLALYRKIVLLIPLMLFLPTFFDVKGIFISEAVSDSVAGISAGLLFMHFLRKTKKNKGKKAALSACDKVLSDIEKEALKRPELYGNTNFINNQRSFDDTLSSFGIKGNINKNGCGSIAMYNVLHAFGEDIPYRTVIENIAKDSPKIFHKSSTIGGGVFGLNPLYMKGYLKRQGYEVKRAVFKRKDFAIKEEAAYIAIYLWFDSKHSEIGGHYEALIPTKEGALQAYNISRIYEDFRDYEKMKKSEGGFLMQVYEIKRYCYTKQL